MSRQSFALAMFVLVAALAACNKPAGEETQYTPRVTRPEIGADGKAVLRRGNGAEPETLDPHKAQSTTAAAILRDLYEGLTLEAPNGAIVPGVAERWEVSRDQLSYTFFLRTNARWSNGDPVTAEDFVYSLRRSVDPKTGSSYAAILAPILNAEAVIAGKSPTSALGVEALDARTLRITLKGPTPYFIGQLAHSSAYPVHRATVQKFGDKFTAPGNNVSNGAYRMKEWVVLSHVTVERNSHYWDNDKTRIERVRFFAIDNAEAEFKRYLAGELDVSGIPIPRTEWAKKHLKDEYRKHPSLGVYYYGLNTERPPFKDNRNLRLALSMAIERERIPKYVTLGDEIPAYGWVPPETAHYTPQPAPWGKWPREQQVAEAKRLYALAGFSRDKPLEVELRYNTSEGHKKIATVVAYMWKEVLGARVKLVNEEWKVLLQNVDAKKITQVYRAGWIGDYNDANTFAELMHSRFGLNGTGYSSPQYDALVDQAAITPDLDQRQRMLEEAERVLLEDMPVIPIYFYVSRRVVKPYVKGYEGNIMDHQHSKDMWIEP